MDWVTVLILAVVIVGVMLLKKLGQLSSNVAMEYLRQGAKVIDVRSPAEFQERRLPKAINIPLGELKDRIPLEVPDREEVLLLHCLSGGRSAMGVRVLKNMGYPRAFNLGSYSRAERIIRQLR